MINSSNYVGLVLRTESNDYEAIRQRLQDCSTLRLLHGLMGLQTEVGEMMDVLKKHIFYGKPMDWDNLFEEAGDLSWYLGLTLAILHLKLGVTMDDCLAANIAKLKARYPAQFEEAGALFRDLEAEKITMDIALEGAAERVARAANASLIGEIERILANEVVQKAPGKIREVLERYR